MIGLTPDQWVIAEDIVGVAMTLGLGPSGAVIGVMTALAESDLTNVDHGDAPGPSSRGVFQQMPSWGPLDCRMTPDCAARLFYDRLMDLDWRSLSPWVAAQRVQQSEFVQGFTGEGSDGTEGWNYLQRLQFATEIVPVVLENPVPTLPIGDTPVTPEQLADLTAQFEALARDVEEVRARLDTLIHAQAAMIVNAVEPYLQKIADKLGV